MIKIKFKFLIKITIEFSMIHLLKFIKINKFLSGIFNKYKL